MDEIYAWIGERRAREEEVVGWCMLDAFYLSPVQSWRKSTFVRPVSVLFGSIRYCHRGSQWGYTFPTTLEIGKALENEEWGIGAKVRRKVQLLVNHRGEWLRVIDDSHDRRACSVSRSVRGTRELVHTTSRYRPLCETCSENLNTEMRATNRGSDVVIGSPSFALSAWVNAGRVNASDRRSGKPTFPFLFQLLPFHTFAYGFIIYASICTGCEFRYKWKYIILFFFVWLVRDSCGWPPTIIASVVTLGRTTETIEIFGLSCVFAFRSVDAPPTRQRPWRRTACLRLPASQGISLPRPRDWRGFSRNRPSRNCTRSRNNLSHGKSTRASPCFTLPLFFASSLFASPRLLGILSSLLNRGNLVTQRVYASDSDHHFSSPFFFEIRSRFVDSCIYILARSLYINRSYYVVLIMIVYNNLSLSLSLCFVWFSHSKYFPS